MESDPILKEVYAMKEELDREVHHDLRALCEYLGRIEEQHKDRIVRSLALPRKNAAKT